MEKLESPREEVINFTSETVRRYSMYLKKFFFNSLIQKFRIQVRLSGKIASKKSFKHLDEVLL